MISHTDMVNLYEFSKTLPPICNNEAMEEELASITRAMYAVKYPMFLTRSRRRAYLGAYLQNPSIDRLHPVIAEMPSYKYLKEWVLSGMTKEEQDKFFCY